MQTVEIENIEIELILDAILKRYGYDFRGYAPASLKRRIKNVKTKAKLATLSHIIPRLLHDTKFADQLFYSLSITVTEMFRDPDFFMSIRRHLIPYLKTFPFLKIWHAGCASGEEVYSLAILLEEEGLYDRTTIFATDFNNHALSRARDGIYATKDIKTYTGNYQKSGGNGNFSDYYRAEYDSAIMNKAIKRNITFANHNLVTDGVFGEMHLILCRNVMIYFNKTLQTRVLGLFDESLIHGGFLALGSKETLDFTSYSANYNTVDKKNIIYQKKG